MVSEGKLSYPDKIHISIQTLSIHTRMFSPTDMKSMINSESRMMGDTDTLEGILVSWQHINFFF